MIITNKKDFLETIFNNIIMEAEFEGKIYLNGNNEPTVERYHLIRNVLDQAECADDADCPFIQDNQSMHLALKNMVDTYDEFIIETIYCINK